MLIYVEINLRTSMCLLGLFLYPVIFFERVGKTASSHGPPHCILDQSQTESCVIS